MAVIGRLKDGGLRLAGELRERVPAVTKGLTEFHPLDGKADKALGFNGVDTRVTVGTALPSIGSAGTIEMWVYILSYGGLFSRSVGAGWADERLVLHFYDGGTTAGNLHFVTSNGTSYNDVASTSVIPRFEPVHLAVTWDTSTAVLNFYINGKLDRTASALLYVGDSGVKTWLGQTEGLAPNFFKGDMWDVRVWNVCRTAQQIKDNMYWVDRSTTGLVANWLLNEGTGVSILDRKGVYTGLATTNTYWAEKSYYGHTNWGDSSGVAIGSGNIMKTATTSAYDSGAYSNQCLGDGGYVEFMIGQNNNSIEAGLNTTSSTWSYTDIDFGILCYSSGSLYVYEEGTQIGSYGTYKAGDLFRVAIESGVVKYYKNGTSFYTSTRAPSYPLYFDCSLYEPGAVLRNLRFSNCTTDEVDGISVEDATSNLIPSGVANMYPTTSNTWATYNDNQYNNAQYFSIGTVGSVSNNIVTLSSVTFPIYTYDVIKPETSGGGVTAGTYYFVKKWSSNSFSLHAYDGTDNGSKGYGVHDSINNDVRVAITADSFPTSWKCEAHSANMGIVKEIITNGFSKNGRTHDCIRLHKEHRLDGLGLEGMAYGVTPTVTSGLSYTFSFYVRAANPASVGTNMNFQLWVTSGFGSINVTVNSTEWQRVVETVTAPASGACYMYFFPAHYSTIDISEIQCEQKSFDTSFVAGSRPVASRMYLPSKNIINFDEGTISCWFRPSPGFFSQESWNRLFGYCSTTNCDEIEVMRNYTGTNLVMAISNNSGSPQTSWSSCPSATISAYNWYHVVARWSISNGRMSLTVNGVKNEQAWTSTYQPTVQGSFTVGFHNVAGRYSHSQFRDLAIYNRELADAEVTKLYNGTVEVTSSGNLVTPKVIVKPAIPSDVFYLPLKSNAKDVAGMISPSTESNTVYEHDSVWVGTAATNKVVNPTGTTGAGAAGSCVEGWDVNRHLTATSVGTWTDGWNAGVEVATTGYHAQWVYEGKDGGPCMKFIDLNTFTGYPHRWLGISQVLDTPTNLGWSVGSVVSISWDQKVSTLGKKSSVGIYHKRVSTGAYDFTGAYQETYSTYPNQWGRTGFTFTVDSDWDLTQTCSIYFYGMYGTEGILWIDNVQIETKASWSPCANTTRSAAVLAYNFYKSLHLDWNGSWSIVYWKKPVGTYVDTLTGYNIESLGCGSNSVGGGYAYTGKTNNSDSLAYYLSTGSPVFDSGTFSASDYFGKWHMTSIVRNGTTFTYKIWGLGSVAVRTASATMGTVTSNYFVNQYGYDFQLGGWNGSNPCNNYYRDLVVAKRALTDAELTAMHQTQMRMLKGKIQVRNGISQYNTLA